MVHYSKELADFAVDLSFEDIPTNVVHQAKKVILDHLASGLAAYDQESGNLIVEYVRGLGGKSEATIWGYGDRVGCANAALANGTLAETMETQDVHWGRKGRAGHPAVVVLPAAVAAAELAGASGRELITAAVLGIDVAARTAEAIGTSHRPYGFNTIVVCGTIGAGLAAAKLFKLDKEHMLNALGIVGAIEPVGISQYFSEENFTMDKELVRGWAAHSGVAAALLAQKGFTGAKDFLEGERYGFCQAYTSWGVKADLSQLTEGLGKEFHIMRLGLKWYPSCGNTHPPIEAVLEILKGHKINAENVEKITVKSTAWMSTHKCGVTNFRAAFFDIPYNVAVTLIDGDHSLEKMREQHSDERVRDPEVLALRERVEMVVDPEIDRLYGGVTKEGKWIARDKYPAVVIIKMKDGREYSHRIDDAKGTPAKPLTDEEVEKKFEILAHNARLGENRIKKVIETVEQLEELKSINKLTELLSPKSRS